MSVVLDGKTHRPVWTDSSSTCDAGPLFSRIESPGNGDSQLANRSKCEFERQLDRARAADLVEAIEPSISAAGAQTASVCVDCPKGALVRLLSGGPKLGSLKRLKNSPRKRRPIVSVRRNCLCKSACQAPKPRNTLHPKSLLAGGRRSKDSVHYQPDITTSRWQAETAAGLLPVRGQYEVQYRPRKVRGDLVPGWQK